MSTAGRLRFRGGSTIWFAIWFAAVIVAFFADRSVFLWMSGHQWTPLNELMIFLTDYGMLFALILFAVALFEKKLTKQLVLVGLAFAVSLEVSYIIKEIFTVPRPYETWDTIPLKFAEGFSFPSMHTAFIFSALPFFGKSAGNGEEGRLGRRWWFGWFTLAVMVALSRVYVGVHYVSDVVAGAGLGYAVGWGLWTLEERHHVARWVMENLQDRFEVRRQAAHALIGLLILTLYYLNLISSGVVLTVLVAGGILCVAAGRWKVWGLDKILEYFERPSTGRGAGAFPGRGSFFMVLGCLLAMLLFEKPVALAAIAIMALGDSVTNVFGRYFGEVRLPYNHRKTLDGALAGVMVATLGAFFFVPFHVALAASVVAIFVETLDLKLWFIELDDNILVPLVAGVVMVILL